MPLTEYVDEFSRTLGEELLEPTRIYSRPIRNLRRDFKISGIIHITGGGLIDNPPRILPKPCKALIKKGSWTVPPIFSYLQKAGNISEYDMLRTFNSGLGLIIVINEDETEEALLRLKAMGETPFHIGSVESRDAEEEAIQFM
jgi:phosphoribosylformylglycinamidine cyclo-ligase